MTNKNIEIRKPVSAIHISRKSLTLLQQKLMNIILLYFYQDDDPLTQNEYQLDMPVNEINRILGYGHRKTKQTIAAIDQLISLKIRWNWTVQYGYTSVSTMISSMVYDEELDMVQVVIPLETRKILVERDIYDMISISRTVLFRSRYSLALYELCHRFLKIGHTSRIAVPDLVELLGVKANYKNTYDIKKFVIEPAISEINRVSDINVTVSYVKSGRGGKIMAVQFFTEYKPRISTPKFVSLKNVSPGISRADQMQANREQKRITEIIDTVNLMPDDERERVSQWAFEECIKGNKILERIYRKEGLSSTLIQSRFDWFNQNF